MIITLTGDMGSGKSTVGKMLAAEFGYKHYSSGDFMRELASQKGITLLELGEQAETADELDKKIDDRQVELGKIEDNFVIDGRLSWHFIPKSLKVYLKVNIDEGSKRIFNSKRKKEHNLSLEDTKEKIILRKQSEIKRFKEYYGIDHTNESNFDLVIDTTNISADQVKDKIKEFINK